VSTEPGAAQSELVIALVAAVGTGIGMVGDQVATQLDEYDYRTHVLRLSDYLAEQAEPTFRGKPFDEELWEAMTRWKPASAGVGGLHPGSALTP